MYSKLAEKLKFTLEPVAIQFTDTKPDGALQFEEGKRGCIAAMLVSAAQGKITVFDEKTYGCPAGGVGLCFGDTLTKRDHKIEYGLSTGIPELAASGNKDIPKSAIEGERFFASPEIALKWKKSLPYTESGKKYVVFMPLSKADENNPPDLICIFANADQLSALVIMSGFNRGEGLNALAPFGAACHQILYAYQEIGKEQPKGIMGFFDMAQRHRIPKELLTYTVPYQMYLEIENSVDESLLTTEQWEKIADR